MKRCSLEIRVLLWVLISSLILHPFSLTAQTRGYGQALGSKSGAPGSESGEEKSQRFLQRGRLSPGETSEEESQELAGFTQSVVSYQVHVLGEVGKPGTYRVNPSTRVDEMLKKAGGINEIGSSRKVEVRREGGKAVQIDITDFRRNGNLNANPYVLDNDVVFVPFAERLIRFEGATHLNGVIELNNEKTLEDALKTAGGMTVDVSIDEPITVVRFDKGGNRQAIEVANNPEALRDFNIQNGDLIYVPNVIAKGKTFDFNVEDIPGGRTFYPSSKDAVFIIGAVSSPGAYPFNPFSNAEEYVLYAGPTKASAVHAIRINTVDGKMIRGRKSANRHKISPGDTIVVPERIVTVEKGLMWYNTIISSIFTGYAFKQLLK